MTFSNWKWIYDKNPDLGGWVGDRWQKQLKKGEHILWACANPSCLDESGKRTVFDRGTNLRGPEFCPKCVEAMGTRRGKVLDPEIQAQVDALPDESNPVARVGDEDSVSGQAELYRWKRERINPKMASRWLDQFKE